MKAVKVKFIKETPNDSLDSGPRCREGSTGVLRSVCVGAGKSPLTGLILCSYLSAWGGTFLGLLWGRGSVERLPGGLGWRRKLNRSIWAIVSCNSNAFSSLIRPGEGGCGGASLQFPDYSTHGKMNSACPSRGWDRATPAWARGALCASLPSPNPSKHPRMRLSPAALCCHASLYKNSQICRCPVQHHNSGHCVQRQGRLRGWHPVLSPRHAAGRLALFGSAALLRGPARSARAGLGRVARPAPTSHVFKKLSPASC